MAVKSKTNCGDDLSFNRIGKVNNIVNFLSHCGENALTAVDSVADVIP